MDQVGRGGFGLEGQPGAGKALRGRDSVDWERAWLGGGHTEGRGQAGPIPAPSPLAISSLSVPPHPRSCGPPPGFQPTSTSLGPAHDFEVVIDEANNGEQTLFIGVEAATKEPRADNVGHGAADHKCQKAHLRVRSERVKGLARDVQRAIHRTEPRQRQPWFAQHPAQPSHVIATRNAGMWPCNIQHHNTPKIFDNATGSVGATTPSSSGTTIPNNGTLCSWPQLNTAHSTTHIAIIRHPRTLNDIWQENTAKYDHSTWNTYNNQKSNSQPRNTPRHGNTIHNTRAYATSIELYHPVTQHTIAQWQPRKQHRTSCMGHGNTYNHAKQQNG